MANTTSPVLLESTGRMNRAGSQFKDLNLREPGQWPLLPKICAWILAAAAVVLALWFGVVSAAADELEAARKREPQLKQDYRGKLGQAVNLAELRKQKQLVQEYVTQLEKQLPGKADIDALLSDINQAAIGRGLQWELFRPGLIELKDYYAELPIALRVSGRYHDIGAFAADVANLSRIVTLHNLALAAPPKEATGFLSMEATARTYRYLDVNEIAEIRRVKAAAEAAKAGKK